MLFFYDWVFQLRLQAKVKPVLSRKNVEQLIHALEDIMYY